jgi:hypothetical protein
MVQALFRQCLHRPVLHQFNNLTHPGHDGKESLGLARGKHCGWFVKDKDGALSVQELEDFNRPLFSHGQLRPLSAAAKSFPLARARGLPAARRFEAQVNLTC